MTECSSGKRRYASRSEAMRALAEIHTRRSPGRKTPKRTYQCHACGGWHLTSRKDT